MQDQAHPSSGLRPPSPTRGEGIRSKVYAGLITIEVAYGSSDQQTLINLAVPPTCTVEQAIIQSGILQCFPAISLTQNKVGIFGQIVSLKHPLAPGDRIELYRPVNDPKQARRRRGDI